ncbi:MAG: HEAT repeat domain-containing protein [Proteobacteria bacterium]|nr:HEAT repeat domain-containing protein [Pseudomonadota bacterium]
MLRSDHYELLDKLRFGKSKEERSEALRQLIVFEADGKFEENDFLALLKNEDSVLQTYAIGALGRRRTESGMPLLKTMYLDSNNPLFLSKLLETFSQYGTDEFVKVVLKRLKKPVAKRKVRLRKSSSMETIFDKDFILDQILVPSLKYLQIAGDPKVGKTIKAYLDHEDSNVRWHTLVAFDKLTVPISDVKLLAIEKEDEDTLVREQASIMLAKKKNN